MSVLVNCRIIRFWANLVSDQNELKYSRKIYKSLYDLHSKNLFSSTWLTYIKKLLISTGFDYAWDSQNIYDKNRFVKNVTISLQNMYKKEWSDSLNKSSKCLLYRNFKRDFGRENYINQLPDMYVFALIKFRCSSHKLEIEIGRRNGVDRENRLCKNCSMNTLGDEFHFVFECPKFNEHRLKFIPKKYLSVHSMFSLCNLISGSKNVQLKLAKFIIFGKIV